MALQVLAEMRAPTPVPMTLTALSEADRARTDLRPLLTRLLRKLDANDPRRPAHDNRTASRSAARSWLGGPPDR